MDIDVAISSYNSFGYPQVLNSLTLLILRDGRDYGSLIKEICITLHFSSDEPPTESLEDLFDEHHENLQRFPKIIFRRKAGKVDIQMASDLIRNYEPLSVSKHWVSQESVVKVYDEIVEALQLLRKRVVAGDDFEMEAFFDRCLEARKEIPRSEEALKDLLDELDIRKKAELDKLGPWESLEVDWADFHVDARELLDDPFYWSSTNCFAPHGNDTGADLIVEYAKQFRADGQLDGEGFLRRLAKSWGYKGLGEVDPNLWDEATAALAFAEIKLGGKLDVCVLELAQRSIARQRDEALSSEGWTHKEERLAALELMRSKLEEFEVSEETFGSSVGSEKLGIFEFIKRYFGKN